MKRIWIILSLVILAAVLFPIFTKEEAAVDTKGNEPPFERLDHRFISQGKSCGAWLYLPKGTEKPPVIVMAHGFGGQRWMRLPAYAETFAKRGMAVFIFDYRGFNDSEGEPRFYINPSRHIEDWKAAIAYVRSLDSVDGNRVALWGTSFSGGHVIKVAAEDQQIRAVVAQVPFTDGITTSLSYLKTPMFALKSIYHGFLDLILSLFSDRRHYVMISSTPEGPFGMMSTPDSLPGVQKLLGEEGQQEWSKINRCPADIVFSLSFYRPITSASKVSCPTLIISAEKDSLFPPDGPVNLAAKMKQATLVSLPMGHFDPYVGELFDRLSVQMADFLAKNLGVL